MNEFGQNCYVNWYITNYSSYDHVIWRVNCLTIISGSLAMIRLCSWWYGGSDDNIDDENYIEDDVGNDDDSIDDENCIEDDDDSVDDENCIDDDNDVGND